MRVTVALLFSLALCTACVDAPSPRGPWLHGLAAHPGEARIEVVYSTDASTDYFPFDPPPMPAASVQIRVLGEGGREVRRVTSTRLGIGVHVVFEDLTNGQEYVIEGRALSAEGAPGTPQHARTVPGVAPRWERIRSNATVGGFGPDGRLLLAAWEDLPRRDNPDLIVFEPETREETRLTSYAMPESDHDLYYPVWSRAGSQVAYVFAPSRRSGGYDPGIHVMDIGAVPAAPLRSFGPSFVEPFSFDEGAIDYLVFADDRDSKSWQRLWLDGTMATVRDYPDHFRPEHPDLSSDGRWLVYDAYDHFEHFLVVEDTTTHAIVFRYQGSEPRDGGGAYGYLFPRWDPTSRRIAVGTQRGGNAVAGWEYEVWILDLDTGRWFPVTGYVNELQLGFVWGMDWSPDGTTIAVSGSAGVHLLYPPRP